MAQTATLPNAVASYIRDLGAWRRQRALEQNGGAVVDRGDCYEAFARYLETLPADDLRLLALSRLTHLSEDGVPAPGPLLSSALAELESYSSGVFDALLDHLVYVAIDDALAAHETPLPALFDVADQQAVEA